jgi:Kyakuja-Dileera-Zisupton transposase
MRCPLSGLPSAWKEPTGRLGVSAARTTVRELFASLEYTLKRQQSRWVYTLFLALDANFRLQREDVSSDKADPGLSKGYSYFVEETKYKAHLKEHSELPQEVSHLDQCRLRFCVH